MRATKKTDELPVIALVGRTNVGKSTLFNRLIEEDKAIVSDIPGTTRTNNVGIIRWRGKALKVIDTGGLTFESGVPLEADILKQSEKAMKLADIILFMVDGRAGLMPQERALAKRMRRIVVKPVVVVANKSDTERVERELMNGQFERLGLGEVFPIAAASGRRVGDLLDHVYEILQKSAKRPKKITEEETEPIRVSIIGKPNVGKSSLFNTLIGEEKVIVSPLPHTTREPHDTTVLFRAGKTTYEIVFVDTAGIRRKAKVAGGLESVGIYKSLEAVNESDLVLLVLDRSEPISQQDRQLGGLLERHAKSVILLINKWDLSADNSESHRHEVEQMVRSYFPHLDFAPCLFVSGLTGYRVHQIFPLIIRAAHSRQTEIPARALEQFLKQTMRTHRPARGKGTRHPKILGLRQLATAPPVFEMWIKHNTSLHRSYVNFVERKLREQFDFFATPIVIKLTKLKR